MVFSTASVVTAHLSCNYLIVGRAIERSIKVKSGAIRNPTSREQCSEHQEKILWTCGREQ